jgi:hypothetical protein
MNIQNHLCWDARIHSCKGKAHPMKYLFRHRREAEVYLQPIRNPALEGGGWSAPRSGRFSPGEDPVPSVQENGCASRPVWTTRSPSLGFDPRTVQAVASCYTDYATTAAIHLCSSLKFPPSLAGITMSEASTFNISQVNPNPMNTRVHHACFELERECIRNQ